MICMVWAGPETLARSPYAVKLIADSSPVVTVQWCLLNVLQSSSVVSEIMLGHCEARIAQYGCHIRDVMRIASSHKEGVASKRLSEDRKGLQLVHALCNSIQVAFPVVLPCLRSLQVCKEELPNASILWQ